MNIKPPKNQAFSLEAVTLIQELCKPLKKVALSHFSHDITFEMGQISMLMSDAEALSFYFQNKMPAICVNEAGRTLDAGIYLGKVIKEHYQDAAIIFPKLPFSQNSIHICTRESIQQQLYSFYFDMGENDLLHWILNNGNLLHDFIENYNVKAHDVLLEAIEPENRTVLPLFKNIFHHLIDTSKPFQIKLIHHTSHQVIHLATQQSICLDLLSKGHSAKEIAIKMQLSHRTIEHYLERIRKLLDCSSNRKLIAIYGEQLFNK